MVDPVVTTDSAGSTTGPMCIEVEPERKRVLVTGGRMYELEDCTLGIAATTQEHIAWIFVTDSAPGIHSLAM